MSPIRVLIYGTVICLGVLQFFAGRWFAGHMRDLLARGQRVPGRRVASLLKSSASGESRSRHKVVAFTTLDGREGEILSKVGVPWDRSGGAVSVIYDPEDLENATLDTWVEKWMVPAILMANGTLMVLAIIVIGGLDAFGLIGTG